MRKLVFDAEDLRHELLQNGAKLRDMLADYRADGFEIVLSMPVRLPAEKDQAIADSLEELQDLIGLCDVVVFGGPGAATRGLHLDDKAVTPAEFLGLRYDELRVLVEPS
jgi:hypothetical protein